MIAYRAMLDVPRELVIELAKLLRAERRARGTRKGTRLLTCFQQALLVLVWLRTKGDVAVVGAGFRVSRATAYRYRDEGITVLAEQAPDLHEALQQVAEQGWSHVVLDGKLFRTDRCAETTESVQGRDDQRRGTPGNTALPAGTSKPSCAPTASRSGSPTSRPGHLHDLTVARDAGVTGALNWAAVPARPAHPGRLRLRRRRSGIKTPFKQPADGQTLAPDNQAYNTLPAPPAASANAASRCSPAAGEHSNGSPSAPAASANSPKPHLCSHNRERPTTHFLLRSPQSHRSILSIGECRYFPTTAATNHIPVPCA